MPPAAPQPRADLSFGRGSTRGRENWLWRRIYLITSEDRPDNLFPAKQNTVEMLWAQAATAPGLSYGVFPRVYTFRWKPLRDAALRGRSISSAPRSPRRLNGERSLQRVLGLEWRDRIPAAAVDGARPERGAIEIIERVSVAILLRPRRRNASRDSGSGQELSRCRRHRAHEYPFGTSAAAVARKWPISRERARDRCLDCL